MIEGNHNGCDSIVTLNLTVNHKTYGDTTAVACETFTWHGQTYTQTPTTAPTFTMTGGNHNGCDSIVALHLTIKQPAHGDTIATACESFTWHGIEYTETPVNNPTFTISGGSQNDCDSIVTLHLTVYHATHSEITVDTCESFTWNDTEYTETPETDPTFTISGGSQNGCDSIITLHLTIHKPIHEVYYVSECESYTWTEGNGETYTVAGDYTYTHPDAHGCTQVDTLHLTLVDTSITIVRHGGDFCDEGYVVLEAQTEMENYLWSTGETDNVITVYDAGIYTVTASVGTDCSVEASTFIQPCEQPFILPNAFSPDNDGINDDFGIPEHLLEDISDVGFSVSIYNRWGTLVFQSSSKYFRWNGKMNDKVYHNNTYNYIIEYRTSNGAHRKISGSVITL
jgi:gliding motility-associated-like protein